MMKVSSEVKEKIKRVRLLVLDVDGVLTEGKVVYDDRGLETKAFDVKDGHGVKLLKRGGVDSAILTSRTSKVVEYRAADLGIELVYQGYKTKLEAMDDILKRSGLEAGELAYVGDDLVDLPFMARVGFTATVSDAVDEVRERVDVVSSRPGGRGAVREICELILKVQGAWEALLERYTGPSGGG